jgi:hypothetical protein
MHRVLIPKIIENSKHEDMVCLEKVMVEMVDRLKFVDPDMYKSVEHKLYKMVYGNHLSKELAHKWVSRMDNKDGTIGAHWSYDQTSQYAGSYDKNDWYAVMNMMYSDYYNSRFELTTYVEMAKDWFADKDGSDGKTLNYYLNIICNE